MNPRPFLNHTLEDLRKLNTRHLLALFRRSRGVLHTCGCLYFCGDDVLEPHEREENRALAELNLRVKLVLNEREHVPSSAESRARTVRRGGRPEKKQLRY